MLLDGPRLATDVVVGAEDRGDDIIVFAHGILGTKANWKSFAKRLCERVPRVRCVLLDLRRHGESHDERLDPDTDTVRGAAADIHRTLAVQGLHPRVLVGHSWGGKAMLALGLTDDPGDPILAGVEHVVVVDSPPGTRTFHGGAGEELERVMAAISSLPPGLARDRKHLVEQLQGKGMSMPLAQWMTTNLVALPTPLDDGHAFRFKFDLDAARRMLVDFGALDLWPALLAHHDKPAIHMVRGGKSDRWKPDEQARLQAAVDAGVVTDVVLPSAGHWVHTDDPEGLLAVIAPLCA